MHIFWKHRVCFSQYPVSYHRSKLSSFDTCVCECEYAVCMNTKHNATQHIIFYIIHSIALSLDLGCFFCFLALCTVGRTLWWGISASQWLYLHTGQNKQNIHTQVSTPAMGFEPTTPAFKWVKEVHALYCAATVINTCYLYSLKTFLTRVFFNTCLL
jgi:hypothetical protein